MAFGPAKILALAAVLVVAFAAGDAAACLDIAAQCDTDSHWRTAEPVHVAGVPSDGMVLIRFSGTVPAQTPPIEAITFEVTLDGMPVAGQLEEIAVNKVLGWRPAAPLIAGQYVATGTIHNEFFVPGDPGCDQEFVPFEFELGVAGAMPPLLPAEAGVTFEHSPYIGSEDLDQLVCCDGAFPYLEFVVCSGQRTTIDQGACLPLEWHSSMGFTVTAKEPEPPAGASMVAGQLVVEGEPGAWELAEGGESVFPRGASNPVCVEVVLRNVVTGEEVGGSELCFGEPEHFGPQTLTPESFTWAAECTGPLYTCENDASGERWDPEQCTAWPEGQATTGDGGTAGPVTTGPTTGGTSGTSGTSGNPSSSSGSGGATSPGDDGLVEHGCACNGGGSAGAFAWVLLFAGLGRRRQASARTRR